MIACDRPPRRLHHIDDPARSTRRHPRLPDRPLGDGIPRTVAVHRPSAGWLYAPTGQVGFAAITDSPRSPISATSTCSRHRGRGLGVWLSSRARRPGLQGCAVALATGRPRLYEKSGSAPEWAAHGQPSRTSTGAIESRMPTATVAPTTYLNFIDGEWRAPAPGARSRTSTRPTRATWSGCCRTPTRRRRRGVQAAQKAFPGWASMPAPARGKILLKAAAILEGKIAEMADLLSREEGKTIGEAKGEVTRAVRILEYFGGEGSRLSGQTIPSERPRVFMYTIRQPLGVVALIAPWNFPIAIPTWKMAPALVSGNAVVFKPASQAPLTSLELVKILEQAGIPKGVLNLVTGSGIERRHAARRASAGARHLVHRLGRRRQGHRRGRRRAAGARPARDGRQEPDHRAGRRRPRRRRRLRAERRVLLDRPALHRDQPRHRREGRRASRSSSVWSPAPRS